MKKFLFKKYNLALLLMFYIGLASAQISADGYSMTTPLDVYGAPQDSVLVLDMTLPNEDVLLITAVFDGNLLENTVSATFNGNSLTLLSGILDNTPGVLNYIMFDISAYKAQSGELQLTLKNTGSTQSELFVVTDAQEDTSSSSSGGGGCTVGGDGNSLGLLIMLLLVSYAWRKRHLLKS